MDLPSLCGSARVCYLAGQRFWVRPLSLDALGTVLAWLDDVLPGREQRSMPPPTSTPEAQAALDSRPGVELQAWLALRDQGFTLEAAGKLIRRASEAERALLFHFLWARRRTYLSLPGGEDIAGAWLGPAVIKAIDRYPSLTLEAVGRLTIDQLDCLATGGCEDEDPTVPRELLQQMHEQSLRNKAAKEAATETN